MKVIAKGIDPEGNETWTTNGNYSEKGCTGEEGNCGCVHAEEELLNIMPDVQTIIISHAPCLKCAKLLADSYLKTLLYFQEYRKKDGIKYLFDNEVNVSHIKEGSYVTTIE